MDQKKLKLSVDTGSVVVEIDDKGEVIGQFKFNPADLDIVRRYEKAIEALEAVTVPEDADADTFLAVSDEIKKQMDYLLNYKVSADIFATCNPLTMTESGDFYCENVIEGIGGLIEKIMDSRIKKKTAKIRKATAKYHK